MFRFGCRKSRKNCDYLLFAAVLRITQAAEQVERVLRAQQRSQQGQRAVLVQALQVGLELAEYQLRVIPALADFLADG